MIIVYGTRDKNVARAKVYEAKYPDRSQPTHSTFSKVNKMLEKTLKNILTL